jgi:glycine/D-amino acid oxidase-like deaminating enzyme/nitrite reductase/ring-hydroxylating ferredoxin subunit
MTQLPGENGSYWLETTPATDYARLAEDIEVDVAVVGGGIAGVCTAWEMAEAGRSVALLEAHRIVSGVTGNTTAKLTSLHTLAYARLRKSAGADAARAYANCQQDAVEHVVATADRLGVECDIERRAAYTYTTSTERVPEIEAEAAAALEAGLPASFVTETGLPFRVAGAVRVDGQVQFHPRRYLLGLADRFVAQGGSIYERSRVTELTEGEPCRLAVETGATVTAHDVVVATHYPVFDRSLLFTRLVPHRELVVAGVIPHEQDPDGMYITTEQGTRSVRTAPYDADRRYLIVTGESFTPGTGEVTPRFRRLAEWATERFGVELTHRWAAQDNASSDHLPYVGRLHPGARHAYVATGYGAWGMSNGVMSGCLIAALIAGPDKPSWADVYDPRRLHPAREAGTILKAQASVAKHFVGDRLHSAHVDSVDEIPPGGGAVVRVAGGRRAVHRDDDGKAHVLSATCSHLGCIVAYNDAERSWDCPCHGSRFGVDGAVLQGPATRPLRRYEP